MSDIYGLLKSLSAATRKLVSPGSNRKVINELD